MQRQILLSVAIALSNIASVAGQAAATAANPLNAFIGAAGAAASQVKSVNAKQTPTSSSSSSATPSPTSAPSPPPSSTAAAGHSGLSKGATIGIIVGAIIAALLILALIGLCCCLCLRRRRRRSKRTNTVTPVKDEEVESWKRPINPGRHYSNYSPAQRGLIPMEQQPTVPLMAAVAAEPHTNKSPSLSQHPAMRQPQNPFVPVPPSPRRTAPNSRAGLTDGTIPGDSPYLIDERAPLRDRSRSNSRPRTDGNGLPTTNIKNPNRPPTPMGLDAFGTPASATILNPEHHTGSPPYSGIGQPYDDMHVHVLQTDAPSRELRHSLNQRGEIAPFPSTTYADQPIYRNSRGYSTPPEVPSRSPNRDKRASMFADSSYDSSLSTTTDSNSSGERYQHGQDPYQPAQRESVAPWEAHQHRFSDTTGSSGTTQVAPPPIPWEESEYNSNAARRQSHSPRQSTQHDGRRRSSRSPATSINGQPRRLRFEDLHSNGGQGNQGYSSVPTHGGHDSFDGYDHPRWSQGVGEAL